MQNKVLYKAAENEGLCKLIEMFVYIQSALSFFQPNAKFSPAKHRRIFSKENIHFSEDTGKFNIEFTKKPDVQFP